VNLFLIRCEVRFIILFVEAALHLGREICEYLQPHTFLSYGSATWSLALRELRCRVREGSAEKNSCAVEIRCSMGMDGHRDQMNEHEMDEDCSMH
jgi:hypothetical protein